MNILSNYLEKRKSEIFLSGIIQRLSNFCLELIEELTKGDEDKKMKLIEKMVTEVIKYDNKEMILDEDNKD